MMATEMMATTKFWEEFWVNVAEDGADVEGVIFQCTNGEWKMAMPFSHNNSGLMSCAVRFNPWTGEELPQQRFAAPSPGEGNDGE